MKAAFEEAAADMGGRAEVEIEVMYRAQISRWRPSC